MRAFRCVFIVIITYISVHSPYAAPAPRQEVSLNGGWQTQKTADLTYPPKGEWKPISIPSYLNGINYQRSWLRREFTPPSSMQGQQVEICFGGVKWNSVVYLNGEKMGGHFGGYEPFAVDVTRQIRFDRPNELLVGVCDWTGVFVDRETKLDDERGQDARHVVKDKILAPVGGLTDLYGIWDEVLLRSHPAVYIRDSFIQPSVRRRELRAPVTIANAGASVRDVRLSGVVLDGDREALALPPRSVTVGAGKEATVELRAPWINPHLWSHEDPYLYQLRLSLSDSRGSGADSGVDFRIPASDLPAPRWPEKRGQARFSDEPTQGGSWVSAGGKASQSPFFLVLTAGIRKTTPESGVADETRTRFGFREFWTEGPDFFLNGKKVHLLATASWPPRAWTERDAIVKRFQEIKASHTFAFRTHTQPWPQKWYDVADEAGLLMIPEGAIWNDDTAYRINDSRFWDNYADHLGGMVDHLKNHPSVVMWSLENEFHGAKMNDKSPALKDLARMGRLVKQWDPTRPITYESDGDPGGATDVIGIHYPHEYPKFTQWPNEADWLDAPIALANAFLGDKTEFFWDRKKPLYFGEFLWIPSADPSWHTVFFGDEAYRDYDRYKRMAKGEAWRMQILGYRRHEVSGISPWTMVEGGPLGETNPMYMAHVWAYRHVAAFLREYDRNFFAGDRVERVADLYNDTLEAGEFEFTWALSGPGVKSAGTAERISLEPGAHVVRKFNVSAPDVSQRAALTLTLEMRQAGKPAFHEEYPFVVYPRPRLQTPPGAAIGLFDPVGKTSSAFKRLGLEFQLVASLDRIDPKINLLVVGARAFPQEAQTSAPEKRIHVIGSADPARDGLDRFVRGGGRAVVLEQDAYPAGFFPAALTPHRSTMTFIQQPDHPALQGMAPEDLKFWRGDHLVTAHEPARPERGGGRALIVSGSQEGIAHAPLLEFRSGNGVLLLSQLLVGEKLETEPTASRLLQNCLHYLTASHAPAERTAVAAADSAFVEYVRGLGLRFDDLSKTIAQADLSPYDLLVVQGAAAEALVAARPAVESFVERGGAVLLHRPALDGFEKLRPLLGTDLQPRPIESPVLLASADDPLERALAREDLYWLGKHTGPMHVATPLATGVADFAFVPQLDEKAATPYDARKMKVEAALGGVNDQGAFLSSGGSIVAEIQVPKAGTYALGLTARGTPAGGVFPIAAVSVSEGVGQKPAARSLGSISVASDKWQTYPIFAELSAGPHTARISFTNDIVIGKEDRNFYLQRLLVAPADARGGTAFLTLPPSLVRVPREKGAFVIDAIRWDTESANGRKAARFACSLLSALGGQFDDVPGAAIEAEDMQPQPGMPHFSRSGGWVALNSAGYIGTQVQIDRPGAYRMEIVARGTPAKGVFPVVEVLLDGKSLGQIELTGPNWRSYPLSVRLPAGRHELRLAFINDLNLLPKEDRNLQLDKVVFYTQ